MSNIVLSDDDIKYLVRFLKNTVRYQGPHHIVNENDVLRVATYGEAVMIEKMKMKYGEDYLKKINQILQEYVKMKGYKLIPLANQTPMFPYNQQYQSLFPYNQQYQSLYPYGTPTTTPFYATRELTVQTVPLTTTQQQPQQSISSFSIISDPLSHTQVTKTEPIKYEPIDLKSINLDQFSIACQTCKNMKSAIDLPTAKADELELLANNCKTCENALEKLKQYNINIDPSTEQIKNIFVRYP